MKRTHFFLLAALGLSAVILRADDPVPAHVLSLDASGHPRADLNLSSSHVTGTLDTARLPAGIGSAFLPGITKPTGASSDTAALNRMSVVGINVGEVRQVVFTSGLTGFAGGADSNGTPFSYVAATYRLVNTAIVGGSPVSIPAPDSLLLQAAPGKAWRLVSAVTSSGDVVLPNGTVLAVGGGFNQSQSGGSVDTSNHGGSISTTSYGGGILTSNYGGSIYTSEGGGSIDTSNGGGYIDISTGGGSISTVASGGSIDTSVYGGSVKTNGSGSPEGVVTANVGSLYCDQNGTAGHVLYVKESGSDSTGWVAK